MEHLTFSTPNLVIRGNGDRVRFTAVSYYDPSNPKTEAALLNGIHERIMPGAFDEALSQSEVDIVCTLDHDLSAHGILGRTPTTLEITRSATGVEAEVLLPPSMAKRVNEMIERNEIRGASFVASPAPWYSSFSKDGNKKVMTIRKFSALKEVSLVFQPCYKASTIKRSEWHQEAEELFYRQAKTEELITKIKAHV